MNLKNKIKALKCYKPFQKKPKKIERTESLTTADELIDLIDEWWFWPWEFTYLYSMMENAKLSKIESDKFRYSGYGDILLHCPLVGTLIEYPPLHEENGPLPTIVVHDLSSLLKE